MARPLRIEYPGALYHVTTRGNARADIYLDDGDRRAFLAVLAQVDERFGWRLFAYCLMGNHYHLLVETPRANLSRGMRQLNGVYTQRFNRAHGRVGHLFQGRYKAILVEREAHLLELCRYVVLNPVRAGMVARAEDWPWSSVHATLRRGADDGMTDRAGILALFDPGNPRMDTRERRAVAAYRRFLAEAENGGAEDTRRAAVWRDLRGGVVLGSEDFAAAVRRRMAAPAPEVPAPQRHLGRPGLAALAGRAGARGVWMTAAYRDHGYTMRDIAGWAGLHYSSVSRIIKDWERKN